MKFEPVYEVDEYYDGPRGGIASFNGSRRRFKSRYLDVFERKWQRWAQDLNETPGVIRLPDAGKPCGGQADCIGNCMAARQEDGTWSSPRCQLHAEDPLCGFIYDGGQYHWIECPIA